MFKMAKQMTRKTYRLHLLPWITLNALLTAGCAAVHTPPEPAYAPAKRILFDEEPLPQTSTSPTDDLARLETLSAILAHADEHAPTLEVARAKVGLIEADRIEAELRLPENPVVSTTLGGRSASTVRGFQFNLMVSQRIEVAGEYLARQEVARARKEVALALVDEVRWQVHVEARRLYRQLLLAAHLTEQAEAFVSFAQRWQALITAEIDAGETSPLLANLAAAELAQMQEGVIVARQYEAALRARLTALIGLNEPERLAPQEAPLEEPMPPPSFESLAAKLQAVHPALRTRELDMVARHARVELERREGWVEPTVGVSYGQEPSLGQGFTTNIWLFHLNLPIPAWRRNQAEVERARAQLVISDRSRDLTLATLRKDLREAYTSLNAAHERVQLYEDQVVPGFQSNLEAIQTAYELGELDLQAVLQMRRQLLGVMVDYQNARRDYYEALAIIESLTGWENEVVK